MKTTHGIVSCIAIAYASIFSTNVMAQNYGSFGDNIADPGNIPAILQQANERDGTTFDTNFPASPPGFENRYSNGLTAAEVLPSLLDFDLTDIQHNAVGNAFSDKLPVDLAGGILLGSGSAIPGPIGRGLTPLNNTDIAAQVDDYITANPNLGANDLMLIYASGNDGALALNTVALTIAPQDQAIQTIVAGAQVNAINTAASTQKLLDAGAGTVLVSNLPNIGQTPAARAGGLSGQQLATLFSTTTNDALNVALSNVDRNRGTVIVADSFTLTNDIVANPLKYGFSDVTNPCALVPSCVAADSSVQDQFLFWDPFYPTAQGHAISAAFLADTINAPRTISALAEQGRYGTEQYTRGQLGQTGDGLWISGRVGYERFRRNSSAFAMGYEAEGPAGSISLGWSNPLGLTAGLSLGYTEMDVDFASIGGGFDRRSVNIGAFASFETPIVDLAASLAFGFDNYDNLIRVTGVAGQISSGETDGDSFAIIVQASKDYSLVPGFQLTPIARLGYSRSDIDAFTESGATGLSQQVENSKLSKTFAELGMGGSFDLMGANAWVRGLYHVRIDGGTQTIRTALISAPGFTRSADVRAADRDYGRLEAGISGTIANNLDIGLSGNATFADDDFNHLGGQLWLKLKI